MCDVICLLPLEGITWHTRWKVSYIQRIYFHVPNSLEWVWKREEADWTNILSVTIKANQGQSSFFLSSRIIWQQHLLLEAIHLNPAHSYCLFHLKGCWLVWSFSSWLKKQWIWSVSWDSAVQLLCKVMDDIHFHDWHWCLMSCDSSQKVSWFLLFSLQQAVFSFCTDCRSQNDWACWNEVKDLGFAGSPNSCWMLPQSLSCLLFFLFSIGCTFVWNVSVAFRKTCCYFIDYHQV